MLNEFNNEDFERFLKQQADGLRMRPSGKVWDKIDQRMNRRRRGVVASSIIFLITASLFGYYLVDSSKTIGDPLSTTKIIQEPVNSIQKRYNNTTEQKENETFATSTTTGNRIQQPAATSSAPFTATLPAAASIGVVAQPSADENIVAPLLAAAGLFVPTIVDEYQPPAPQPQPKEKTDVLTGEKLLTIESVINSYRRRFKSPKTEVQFIFTPTVSYRRLTENKSFLREIPSNSSLFTNATNYNVNSVVSHKPALGLELGAAFKYRVSKNIKLRSGLQFNISRYDIKAYSAYQPVLATIALNNRNGVDSLNTMTRFRNLNNSSSSDWLENAYFQVSAPIGAEIKLAGKRHTHFGIATTVQPTYVIGNRAYLISADYKNYSQVPSLTRRWNVHTAVETYVGYTTGKLAWQIGPQVRYQLLSSFDTEYPVKENLFDFGLKVGVSLNKQ